MEVKYIFVLGGVTSSLGKGIIAASVAKLLRSRGLSVAIQKFDPYINVDSGTLNPYEHGECYVTEDGAECDLDLGHYERFLNTYTSKINNVSTGRIYRKVIEKERQGAYLGKTVQVVPHITDEIKRMMLQMGKSGRYDIVITELGGTVGDIESLPFVEAVRQLQWELDPELCMVIHLTYIPYLSAAKELKTKPTQHSVRVLQQNGVHPDVIVCRTEYPLPEEIRKKVALFCNVKLNAVIESIDADSIYQVPLLMLKERLDELVLKKFNFNIEEHPSNLTLWRSFLSRLFNPKWEIDVALIGKYTELQDAYKSILESFIHAGAENECRVNVHLIQSENLTNQNIEERLKEMSAILVAPGFGERGAEGKIVSVKFAREQGIPFL
ncbi:MAG: CTP synthase, partial [Bacteroidales bacterium]